MREVNLLPCPFCGGKANVEEFDDGSGGVLCSECGFMPLTHASYGRNKSKQKAIAEWNQRREGWPHAIERATEADDEPIPYVVKPEPIDAQIDIILDILWAEKRAKLKAHLKPLLSDAEAWDMVKHIVSRGLA